MSIEKELKKNMKINIYNGLEGAKKAEGLTVVIDVFRAFTVECFLFEKNIEKIYAVGDVETCLDLKSKHPDYFLVGERKGIKLDGFDIGNSPSLISSLAGLEGKTVVHSTSAGVQGIVNAKNADEIITGSLVNASAVVRYIRKKNPDKVSLVAMGLNGTEESPEDMLCAGYIRDLLMGKEPCIHNEISALKADKNGAKFFKNNISFPEADFFCCLVPGIFDFVLRVQREENGLFAVHKVL